MDNQVNLIELVQCAGWKPLDFAWCVALKWLWVNLNLNRNLAPPGTMLLTTSTPHHGPEDVTTAATLPRSSPLRRC
ncbi:Hypothetical predicted protein [Olea europaea subsp. europaea]|uniref:Uncharacterized protein n=1 Tax=Olea europaea subsp. europaea TaxID=158383 RepID=A0A8S0UT62_OLEEU|nr:Hypothetical predicted protein [Olea europaea subsp. europaea]